MTSSTLGPIVIQQIKRKTASRRNINIILAAGTQCSFRKLDEKEKNSLILKTFKTCVATEGDTETQLKIRDKYCFGWN